MVFKQLLEKGFCVASVDYRLWKKEGTVSMRDCVIDSAGGQICQMLLLSSPESLPGDPALAGTPYKMVAGVSWYGPCDFEKTALFNHDDREDFRDRFGPRILKPDSKPEEKLALYREMGPINYLKKTALRC